MFDQVSTVRSLASAQLTQLNLKFSDWMFFTETVGSPSRHLSLCFHEYRRAPLTSSQRTRRFQSQLFIFYSDEALELPPTVVCAENDQDFLLFSNACYSHCLHPLGKCIKPQTLTHLLWGENKAVRHVWEGHVVVMHGTLCALLSSQIVSISNHLPCCCVEHLGFTSSMPRHS